MFGQKDDASDQDTNIMGQVPEATTPVGGEGVPAPAPVASAATDPATQDQNFDVFSPAGGFPSAASNKIRTGGQPEPPEPADSSVDDAVNDLITTTDMDNGGLESVKHRAIDDLVPIVDKLDLPPTEKFRTIMMLLQSTDNQGLVEKAYAAAHAIEDDKERAQALLDVVNEINYFTHPGSQPPAEA